MVVCLHTDNHVTGACGLPRMTGRNLNKRPSLNNKSVYLFFAEEQVDVDR